MDARSASSSSATALQMLSSLFNFLDISNFFRDCAWGLLLIVFLANVARRSPRISFAATLIPRSPNGAMPPASISGRANNK